MKLEYDPKTDTLYVQFNDNPVSTTQTINNLVQVDLDEHGHPVQIELLSASHYGDISEVTYKFLSGQIVGDSNA